MSNLPEKIIKLAEVIKQNGGRAMLVGGSVRDELMGIEPKDFDVEVYGIEPQRLREILDSFGKVDAVGEAFTVYKIGSDLDVSLPRRERKVSRGHKGFVVEGDKDMSFAEAAKRRDFTINAILKDILTGEIVDVYGGRDDIENKILRVVSKETFAEDSLRVLRAAQFAARFEFDIDAETVELCREIDVTDLPKERIWSELEKLLLKARKPSIGLRWLYDLNVVEQLFPEMKALVGVPQESEWHPEGWVFSALSPESFGASVAEAFRADRGNSSDGLRQFVFGSSASATIIPNGDGASDAQPSETFFADLKTADGARTNDISSTAEFSPTVSAESQSLMWSFGSPTALADEVVRVVFKISLNKMRSIVFSAVDDFEIVRGIVLPVAVFVMNMLKGFELSSENKFHNQTVDAERSVLTLSTGVGVSVVVVDARTSAVDNDVFFYFDLSFVGNRQFINQVKNSFSSNCFEVGIGDVAYHTLLVVDRARELIDDLPYAKKVTVMLAAICHDFGKPPTTQFFDGRWRSHAHDEAGVVPTISFLDKLGIYTINGFDVREQVIQLVRYHLKPGEFYKQRENLGDGAFRRLARKVEPDLLYRVSRADTLGRNADWIPREKWFDAVPQEWFIERARELEIENKAPKPILMGRHLIEIGLKPSAKFGEITKIVYEMQLDGQVKNLEEAINEAKKLIDKAEIDAVDRKQNSEPEKSEHFSPEISKVLLVCLIAVTGIVYYFSNPHPQSYYDYTFRIADNFLHGQIGLPITPLSWLNELIPIDGFYYSAFPLGSVLTMLPFALFKAIGIISDMPSPLIVALTASGICAFLLLISREYVYAWRKRILLVAAILFGTWMWTDLAFGGAWQIALGFAMLGELGAIYFTVFNRKPLFAGIFFALAFGNRTEILLTAPIFMFLLWHHFDFKFQNSDSNGNFDSHNESKNTEFIQIPKSKVQNQIWFCLAPFLLGLATLIYNYTRFSSPFDFGYARIPGVLSEPWYNHGIFSLYYIPNQAYEMLFKLWDLKPAFPYLQPGGFSSSILVSSPFLFLLLRFGARDKFLKYTAWAAIVVLTFLLWTHGNSGGWQFSYRYAMILLPWIFVVLLENSPKKITFLEWFLYLFSIIANAFATYLFFYTDYIKP